MAGLEQEFPFSDVALARRLERTEAHSNAKLVEARAAVEPESGAGWIEVAGAYAMFDGVSSPVTQTFGLGLFEKTTDAALDEIEAFFQDRGAAVCHEVSPLAGVGLAETLVGRGYKPVEFTSVMCRPIGRGGEAKLPANEKIQVRPIGDDEGQLWAKVTAKGWGELPGLTDYLERLAPLSTRREDSVSFLAELEGRAIASAALCLHQGVALLAGACTIPEVRQQGAQRAMMAARFQYAADNDCDLAMMCAAPGSASQRNAQRYGFRIAYTRIKWQLSQDAG